MTAQIRWGPILALLVVSCTTATPEIAESRRDMAGALSPGEAVSVVSLVSQTGASAAGCVADAIGKADRSIRIVAPARFRDGMFPWFEPGTTPTTVAGLARLMDKPVVRRQVAEFGVRYVVAVGGRTAGKSGQWGGTVAQGPGVAAMVGGFHYSKTTNLAGVILDLQRKKPVGEVSASASGGGGAGMLFIVPYLYFAPDTERITCEAIAGRVVEFLKGEPPPSNGKSEEAKR